MTVQHRSPTVETTLKVLGEKTLALVRIDSPPVNAGSVRVRSDLLDAFERLAGVDGLAGVVLVGSNGNFVAGSDMREFDAPPLAPHLPDVIASVEALPVPVVAAIEGAALGGGFELALGCDARIGAADAAVGLPEVTLGLVPGAGGTVRLPRLVGAANAIALITSGRRVKADEARALGMLDKVVETDVVAAAEHFIANGASKRVLRAETMPEEPAEAIIEAESAALKRAKGLDSVPEAIALIKANSLRPAEDVLTDEREASLRLRVGRQSKALRHLFFAEREAARRPEGGVARIVGKVGVVGAGRMGAGIALAFATRGIDVVLADKNADVLASAVDYIAQQAEAAVSKGRATRAEDVTDRVTTGTLDDMADCDLVVEAVIEEMDIKRAVFAALDSVVPPDAILATNTSYLDVNAIAAASSHPERVAGLHFFNPAHVMKLVEIVDGERTAPDTVATLLKLARTLGKIPVVAKVGEGFIGNRIFAAYRKQCEFLLEEGAFPQNVDEAMRGFGMAMGPFAVFDLAGLDVAWAMRKRLAPTRHPKARYVEIADLLCEEGRFGRKTGKGWYDYASGTARPDPHVEALIVEASAAKGIKRKLLDPAAIQARLLAAMINEAAWVLAEGVAARPGDIDLVLVNGYGFPKLKGGILHWAAHEDRAEIVRAVKEMAEASGVGIEVAANLEQVLDAAAHL